MTNYKLHPEEKRLLHEIIIKHQPKLLPLLDILASSGNIVLTSEQRENLREVIADELVVSGLDKNYEPNPRGLILEGLIDRLWYFSEDSQ
ncbi:hypothetical protein Psfp_02797 [Pelotomaculum sp. FP]|uniref:hypothetical protein n=1 Tax=Pelotomaculum sp. FP TaxID=261474 RepID=UPI0010654858|nr:hypothetical protein [Pelotomaculum sp. FP]TEB14555.1 hypothetical protein Psfp_02797 [Pelotomaculum sp. FP]